MKTRTVKKVDYKVYESVDEFLENEDEDFVYWKDWNGHRWVESDDGQVAEVIANGVLKNKYCANVWIRTPIGQVGVTTSKELSGDITGVITRFSSKHSETSTKERVNPTKDEIVFARLVAHTDGSTEQIIEAYKKAFPKSKEPKYTKNRAVALFNTERIQAIVREETIKVMNDLDLTEEWIVNWHKKIIEAKDSNYSDKTNNLKMLSKYRGMQDEQKSSMTLELGGVITPERLKEIQRGALPAPEEEKEV